MTAAVAPRWSAAELAAAAATAVAVDPHGVGGAVVRAGAGPARDAWCAWLADLCGDLPFHTLPATASVDRLLGGLDLAATLAAQRPVLERGLLATADGGMLVVPGAERLPADTAGIVASAHDRGAVRVARDGLIVDAAARVALLLLDESEADEPPAPAALRDRAGVVLDLGPALARAALVGASRPSVAAARGRLWATRVTDEALAALVAAAAQLGVASLRAPLQAVRVARALAAHDGDLTADETQLALAAALVLLPRATVLPAEAPPAPPPAERPPDAAEDGADTGPNDRPLEDRLVASAQAALPPNVLALLTAAAAARRAGGGRRGVAQRAVRSGRRVGTRRGDPRRGQPLDLLATVRAAAPWQRVRGADRAATPTARLRLVPDDFRVKRLVRKTGATVIFAVDASGSSALQRLGEAKGAVELLLGESYVRRDKVALIAFRGTAADVVLPPTRSLARARRALAGLAGGGGTPLASAIDAAATLALRVRREGGHPLVVLLTDGRANVRRDGSGGRGGAEDDARAAARQLPLLALPGLVIDTSPRPNPFLRDLAERLGGPCLPLPSRDPNALGRAVRDAARDAS